MDNHFIRVISFNWISVENTTANVTQPFTGADNISYITVVLISGLVTWPERNTWANTAVGLKPSTAQGKPVCGKGHSGCTLPSG